jgi:hypothetical protein
MDSALFSDLRLQRYTLSFIPPNNLGSFFVTHRLFINSFGGKEEKSVYLQH